MNEQSRQRSIQCMEQAHKLVHNLLYTSRRNASEELVKQDLVRLVNLAAQAIASY